MRRLTGIAALVIGLALAPAFPAQYFGQNKVRHRTLRFQVARTQHFDIYYYPEEAAATHEVARMAERWYTRLSTLLHHQLTTRQTLILYATHTDFEQTTVLPGMIEATVGGVTLSLGRKIVMPLAGPLGETDHVLGHELVHAFQYDMTTSRGRPLVAGLPLWFVEGMAEYLSLGPADSHTAMWLRDAVARDAMPTVETLSDTRKYFPYRFGQAFWAYVGGRYGDDKIAPLLIASSQRGSVDAGLRAVLHISAGDLSSAWKEAAVAVARPVLAETEPLPRADLLIAQSEGGGRVNASPAVSPDGNWMMYYSERGLFAIDLYLADGRTGRVVRRITETAVDPHFQNLLFISSAGAWSAHSRRFAFGHVQNGQARISIYDLQVRKVTAGFAIAPAGNASAEVFNPSWSPDGRQIAFSANVGGLTNLYVLDTQTGVVRKLTDDAYAALQPAWSPDGRAIAFVTDRFTSDLSNLDFGAYRLALLDPATGAVTLLLPADAVGNQTNPQWGPDGASLYYRSDANGIPNLYRFDRSSSTVSLLTNLQTGVSGITALSPAFSVATESGAVVYSAFSDNGYDLVKLSAAAAGVSAEAAAAVPAQPSPAMLPARTALTGAVPAMLANPNAGLPPSAELAPAAYRAGLGLDYVAPPSLSVGVGPYGTQLGGGTALHFSDVLGTHSLTLAFGALTTNGGAKFYRDLSAQALYLNESHRWTWGVSGGQSPLVGGDFTRTLTTANGRPVVLDQDTTLWQMNRQAVGVLAYPFSRAQRLEFTAGYNNIGYAAEQRSTLFDLTTGAQLASKTQDVPAPPALNFAVATAALVFDTSIFGGTSPILGQSYRLQLGMDAGSLTYQTILLDYRRYLPIARPLSFAGRAFGFGRYGSGARDPRLQELYLGEEPLVRGYDFNSISVEECGPNFATTGDCPLLDRLLGSKVAAINAELRLQLFGPLGAVASPSVPPVEIAPFFDAGTAWISSSPRHPVSSQGAVLRVNLLGFAVASIDYAFPNQRPLRSHVWEFTLQPGY